MAKGYVDAFKSLGASLKNPQWSFSALADDGSVVISCWSDFFVRKEEHGLRDVMRYRDHLQRVEHNKPGHAEIRSLLELAWQQKRAIRVVIARAGDPRALSAGRSASSPGNSFAPRQDLIGELVDFDGDMFVIDFRKAA